jgi:hypothetical protein
MLTPWGAWIQSVAASGDHHNYARDLAIAYGNCFRGLAMARSDGARARKRVAPQKMRPNFLILSFVYVFWPTEMPQIEMLPKGKDASFRKCYRKLFLFLRFDTV